MPIEFYQTEIGRRFFSSHVPTLLKQLTTLTNEVKRSNELNEGFIRSGSIDLETLANVISASNAHFLIDDIAKYEPKAAQILDVLVKTDEN